MYDLKNYDSTDAKEHQPYENPPPQGYVLKVVGVDDKPSSSNRPMVTLALDIAEGPHAGAFDKYPKPYRQIVDGESMPYFKAMIKYFTESNPASLMNQVIFTNRDGSKGFNPRALLGLKIGGNVGEAEYTNKRGEVAVGLEVRFLGSSADAPKMRPLQLKKLDKAQGQRVTAPASGRPQGGSAPMADDTLPF